MGATGSSIRHGRGRPQSDPDRAETRRHGADL